MKRVEGEGDGNGKDERCGVLVSSQPLLLPLLLMLFS